MQQTATDELRESDYTFLLTDVQWICSLKGMARFKDIVSGISDQTTRKLGELTDNQTEQNKLLGAYRRYRELSARIESEGESARIGTALLLNVPMKTHQEIDPYPLDEEYIRQVEDAARDAEVVPQTLDLGQYPLWKIMREILRQVPEMRVYELEAHLKAFGIPAERSAIESSLKTHRKQFHIATKGREKFVGWKEGNDDGKEEPAPVSSRKIATKAKRQRKRK
ncbi:MAG: hypothetical protein WAM85_24930 [Terracidiphilus sp.]